MSLTATNDYYYYYENNKILPNAHDLTRQAIFDIRFKRSKPKLYHQ